MTSTLNFSRPPSGMSDRAFRAVRRMQAMLPMLTSYARAITGNPLVRVAITSGTPCTDGRVIYLRVPIELGDVYQHDRPVCASRDNESHPLCPACWQQERVQGVLLHEIAHIAFDTFAQIGTQDLDAVMASVIREYPAASGTRIAKLQKVVDDIRSGRQAANYMGLSQLISPYLPVLINALEDARVNRAMYQIRAGTYHMFRALAIDVFKNGIENPDGSVRRWDEQPDNAQIVIGCYCVASGMDVAGFFKPEIEFALTDKQLIATLRGIDQIHTASGVYRLSFKVLEELRRLGFCQRNDDAEDDAPPPPPPPPADQDDSPSMDMEPQPQDGGDDDSDDDENDDDQDTDDNSDDDCGAADADQAESDEQDNDDDGADSDPTQNEDGEGSDSDASGDSDDDDADDNGSDESDAPSDGDVDDQSGNSDDDGIEHDGDVEQPDDLDDGSDTESEAGDNPGETGDDGQDDGDDTQAPGLATETDDQEYDGDDEGQGNDPGQADQETLNQRMHEDPDQVDELMRLFGGHQDKPTTPEEMREEAEVERAIIQAESFDDASTTVVRLNEHTYEKPDERSQRLAWRVKNPKYMRAELHPDEFTIPENMIGPSLLKMRTIFADNKRDKRVGGMRSGRIVSNRLASVPTGNTKVFARAQRPGKKDYFVVLALDVSGSTSGQTIADIKTMGMTLGSLLQRAGVAFAIYAHTGGGSQEVSGLYECDVFVVKAEHESWDDRAKTRLANLNAAGNNLDGHALEFMRKRCDQSSATDKVILYVTDGAMPEANEADEEVVLKREIKACKKNGYSLIGVGMETSSPRRHGLDTVRIDETDDIALLVRELEKRLSVKA